MTVFCATICTVKKVVNVALKVGLFIIDNGSRQPTPTITTTFTDDDDDDDDDDKNASTSGSRYTFISWY